MGGIDKGPMGSRNSGRLPDRIPLGAKPTVQATPSPVQPESNSTHSTRSQRTSKKGAVIELAQPPLEGGFYSTLFLVPKKDRGQRPVVNLKAPSKFGTVPHFKMEGIHTLKNLLQPGDWLVKVDLKDAYFSVPIHPDHRRFLCFPLGDRVYQFTCLLSALLQHHGSLPRPSGRLQLSYGS